MSVNHYDYNDSTQLLMLGNSGVSVDNHTKL